MYEFGWIKEKWEPVYSDRISDEDFVWRTFM